MCFSILKTSVYTMSGSLGDVPSDEISAQVRVDLLLGSWTSKVRLKISISPYDVLETNSSSTSPTADFRSNKFESFLENETFSSHAANLSIVLALRMKRSSSGATWTLSRTSKAS